MAKRKELILFLFPLVFLASCSTTGYLFKAAKYELLILSREKKIDRILADPDVSPDLKKKLRLVLDVRRFGREEIGLTPGRSYTYYADVDVKDAAYVLTAVKSLSWEVKRFWFPIVGSVPYLGFPSLNDARRYAAKLQRSGYDVSIGRATAFSTLGYLPDPVTPVMLRNPPLLLAELLLHEMTHATVYFAGETPFDETLAVMVENLAGMEFVRYRWGEESPEFEMAEKKWHDALLFSRFLDRLKGELDALYSSPGTTGEKLEKKEELYARYEEIFRKLNFETGYFTGVSFLPPNNARVLGWYIYYGRLNELYGIYGSDGKELKAFLSFLKKKPDGVSPWNWIKEWKNYPG